MSSKLRTIVCTAVLVCSQGVTIQTVSADAEPPSYEKARAAYMAKSSENSKGPMFSEADRNTMKRAAEDLSHRLPDPGIKVGVKAPDFSLPNAFGKPVRLSEQWRQGPVVLVFYRGAWCPFCNMHLRTLQQSLPQLEQHGARLILVTPQKPDKSREQLEKAGAPFEVLSDLDSSVMKAYKLYFELDPELVAVYKKHKLDLEDFNGRGRNLLPVPGTFVIDTQGVVRAMHADTDYKERMEPEAIIAALEKIRD
jgi:peroxiredoxin